MAPTYEISMEICDTWMIRMTQRSGATNGSPLNREYVWGIWVPGYPKRSIYRFLLTTGEYRYIYTYIYMYIYIIYIYIHIHIFWVNDSNSRTWISAIKGDDLPKINQWFPGLGRTVRSWWKFPRYVLKTDIYTTYHILYITHHKSI